jgi:hypothetical protein
MAIKVTELDFFQIKENLKAHMKSLQGQGKFTDYDFEGSGMNMLIDLLAYNTHYNAVNANMAMNEVFLDTADRRSNIVSHAKLLGYVPRSRSSAYATIDITVVNPSGNPSALTIDRGTKFTTVINDKQYAFTTLDAHTIIPVSGVYKFSGIVINQGVLRNIEYTVDSFDSTQYFEIPDLNVDRETVIVKVKENSSATTYELYTLAKNFTSVNYQSEAYYIQEGIDGKYEIFFGDGVTSKKLTAGNVINIEWLSTDGTIANGATTFNLDGNIQGNTNVDIATIYRSAGGAERETNQSIKFNAPLSYVAQNRVVTPDDYRAAILENYSNVESITVWGGEQSDPPQYGKAYICIKPKTGETLDDVEKTKIKDQILKPRNIVSITPEIIDPEYTYLRLEVYFKYNPSLTSRTAGELQKLVQDTITKYNNDDLQQFDGVFRHSKLTRLIDTCDPSILSSSVRVYMEKYFTPILNTPRRYQIEFAAPLYTSRSNEKVMKSTGFTYNGLEMYLQDKPQVLGTSQEHSDEGGTHTIEMYKLLNNTKITTVLDIGYIVADKGLVILNSFSPSSGSNGLNTIKISALPNSLDIAPKRNQLIKIDMNETVVTPEIDTIATGGTPAGIGYTTVSRHNADD